MKFFTNYFARWFKNLRWFVGKILEHLSRQNASSCYGVSNVFYLDMFCTQNLGEARYNDDLRKDLLFVFLKIVIEEFIFQRSINFFLHLTFSFSQCSFFWTLVYYELVLSFCCRNFIYLSLAHEIKNHTQILFHLIHVNSQWKSTFTNNSRRFPPGKLFTDKTFRLPMIEYVENVLSKFYL